MLKMLWLRLNLSGFKDIKVRFERKAKDTFALAADGGLTDNTKRQMMESRSIVHSYLKAVRVMTDISLTSLIYRFEQSWIFYTSADKIP